MSSLPLPIKVLWHNEPCNGYHYRSIFVWADPLCALYWEKHVRPFGVLYSTNMLTPSARPRPGTTQPSLPFVIVGDKAFPLKQNMLRPYPGKNLPEPQAVFNYRLSRARWIIENSFGILAKWRLFRRPIIAEPTKVVSYTKAAIALHNYLRTTESAVYCPPGFIDGEDGTRNVIEGTWRDDEDSSRGLESLRRIGGNRYAALNMCTINVHGLL